MKSKWRKCYRSNPGLLTWVSVTTTRGPVWSLITDWVPVEVNESVCQNSCLNLWGPNVSWETLIVFMVSAPLKRGFNWSIDGHVFFFFYQAVKIFISAVNMEVYGDWSQPSSGHLQNCSLVFGNSALSPVSRVVLRWHHPIFFWAHYCPVLQPVPAVHA